MSETKARDPHRTPAEPHGTGPPRLDSRNTRGRAGGNATKLAGAVLLIVGLVALIAVKALAKDLGALGAMIAFPVAYVLLFLATRVYVRGKKLSAPSAERLRQEDPRAPVVYLRSFRDDPRTQSGTLPFGMQELVSEEEQVASVMGRIGPFIALGHPDEGLPQLGAARSHVSDDGWRESVASMLQLAALVVIRVGTTGGLAWELETAVKLVRPERLVLLVPRGEAEYEEFRRTTGRLLLCRLPVYRTDPRLKLGGLAGLIYFGAGWAPRYIELRAKTFPGPAPVQSLLWTAIQPAFEQVRRLSAASPAVHSATSAKGPAARATNLRARMLGALMLDRGIYRNVKNDQKATTQAGAILLASSAAAATMSKDLASLAGTTALMVVAGCLLAGAVWLLGRLWPEPSTSVAYWDVFRGIGFAQVPGLLRLGGLLPVVGPVLYFVGSLWVTAACVIAVREALEYRSVWRAVFVLFLAWLPVLVVGGLLSVAIGLLL